MKIDLLTGASDLTRLHIHFNIRNEYRSVATSSSSKRRSSAPHLDYSSQASTSKGTNPYGLVPLLELVT